MGHGGKRLVCVDDLHPLPQHNVPNQMEEAEDGREDRRVVKAGPAVGVKRWQNACRRSVRVLPEKPKK